MHVLLQLRWVQKHGLPQIQEEDFAHFVCTHAAQALVKACLLHFQCDLLDLRRRKRSSVEHQLSLVLTAPPANAHGQALRVLVEYVEGAGRGGADVGLDLRGSAPGVRYVEGDVQRARGGGRQQSARGLGQRLRESRGNVGALQWVGRGVKVCIRWHGPLDAHLVRERRGRRLRVVHALGHFCVQLCRQLSELCVCGQDFKRAKIHAERCLELWLARLEPAEFTLA